MTTKKLYTANATSVGGRGGHVETDDQRLSFDLKPFSNTTEGTNPEQLFACGYSACFGSAVDAVCKKEKLSPEKIQITVSVDINDDEKVGSFLAAKIDASLPGLSREQAEKVVRKAHEEVCPYSKATRGNIEVKLFVDGKPLADDGQITG